MLDTSCKETRGTGVYSNIYYVLLLSFSLDKHQSDACKRYNRDISTCLLSKWKKIYLNDDDGSFLIFARQLSLGLVWGKYFTSHPGLSLSSLHSRTRKSKAVYFLQNKQSILFIWLHFSITELNNSMTCKYIWMGELVGGKGLQDNWKIEMIGTMNHLKFKDNWISMYHVLYFIQTHQL